MNHTPKIARWILSVTNRKHNRENVLGDFNEFYEDILEANGKKYANRWYWKQASKSIPKFISADIYWGIAMLKNYLRIAVRNMFNHKGYSFLNITGLVIGLAGFIILTVLINYELSYDKFNTKGERIYRLVEKQNFENQNEQTLGSSMHWMGETFVQDYPEVEKAVHFTGYYNFIVKKNNEPVKLQNTYFADPDVFNFFSFELLEGNADEILKDAYSVALSESTSLKLFGGEDPMGRTIKLTNDKSYIVKGIFRDIPQNSHLQFNALISDVENSSRPIQWNNYNHNSSTYILLKKNADVKSLEAQLVNHAKKYMSRNLEYISLQLQPLYDIHLYSGHIMWEINSGKSDIADIYLFSIVAIFLLLIACLNFVILTTARFTTRFREIMVRKTIGALRSELIFQFLGEFILQALISFAIAVLIILAVYSLLPDLIPGYPELKATDIIYYLLMFLPLVVLLGMLSGIYPAFMISSYSPMKSIRSKLENKRSPLQRGVIVSQFTVSVFLIVCTMFFYKQMKYMITKDPGYDKAHTIIVNFNSSNGNKLELIRNELIQDAGVEDVTASSVVLGNQGIWENRISYKGLDDGKIIVIPYLIADYNFISYYKLKITEGRDLSEEFADDRNHKSFIINETLAKTLGFKNPVGEEFRLSHTEWGKIIGVVKDFNFKSFYNPVGPLVIYYDNNTLLKLSVKLSPGSDIAATIDKIKTILGGFQPSTPFEYTFMDEDYKRLYAQEQITTNLVGLFSILAIIISCLGLFGLSTYYAERSMKEIGIRKILGASVCRIVLLLTREFIASVIIANVFGWLMAFYVVKKWLEAFAFRINLDVVVFLLAGVLSLAIAFATIYYKAYRAAVMNPVDVLKVE